MPDHILAQLSYTGPEDPLHPDIVLNVDKRVAGSLVAHLVEQGYFVVPDEKGLTFTITAKYTTGRHAMTTRLMAIIKAWFDEYSGYAGISAALRLLCALPAIAHEHYTPAQDSPLRLLGGKKLEIEVARDVGDYAAVKELQKDIDDLLVQLKQEVA